MSRYYKFLYYFTILVPLLFPKYTYSAIVSSYSYTLSGEASSQYFSDNEVLIQVIAGWGYNSPTFFTDSTGGVEGGILITPDSVGETLILAPWNDFFDPFVKVITNGEEDYIRFVAGPVLPRIATMRTPYESQVFHDTGLPGVDFYGYEINFIALTINNVQFELKNGERSFILDATFEVTATTRDLERDALLALYDETDGDHWIENTGWLGPPGTECSWYGVTCSEFGNHIQRINLFNNRLSGSIPVELKNLVHLVELDLSYNHLSGIIPHEIGQLFLLERLFLTANKLTGDIPPELGNLANLQSLCLSNNLLYSRIPAELGNLTNLQELWLNTNQFTMAIPLELGNLAELQKLDLHNL